MNSYIPDFSKTTADSCDKLVESIKNLNNATSAGDQVLLTLDVHGSPQTALEKTHSVMFGNQPCSLDRIIDPIKALSKKGVRVGLLDFSCFSGPTLSLVDSNICVLAASTTDSPSWASLHKEFFNNTKPGASLEDAFLAARKEYLFYSAPSMTTPIDKEVNKELAPLENLLNRADFFNYESYFPKNNPLKALEDVRKNIETVWSTSSLLSDQDWKELGEALLKYRKALSQIGESNKDTVKKWNEKIKIEGHSMTWFELNQYMVKQDTAWADFWANIGVDHLEELQKANRDILNWAPGGSRVKAIEALSSLSAKEKKNLIAEAKRQEPYYAAWISRMNEGYPTGVPSDALFTHIMGAREIVKYERKLFQALYEKFKKSATMPQSACRDFRF